MFCCRFETLPGVAYVQPGILRKLEDPASTIPQRQCARLVIWQALRRRPSSSGAQKRPTAPTQVRWDQDSRATAAPRHGPRSRAPLCELGHPWPPTAAGGAPHLRRGLRVELRGGQQRVHPPREHPILVLLVQLLRHQPATGRLRRRSTSFDSKRWSGSLSLTQLAQLLLRSAANARGRAFDCQKFEKHSGSISNTHC